VLDGTNLKPVVDFKAKNGKKMWSHEGILFVLVEDYILGVNSKEWARFIRFSTNGCTNVDMSFADNRVYVVLENKIDV